VPDQVTSTFDLRKPVPDEAPKFVKDVTSMIIAGRGDDLPVSLMPDDGTFPSATTQWEKRAIALETPIWDPETCIQCGKCVMVCPHAVIRSKIFHPDKLSNAPSTFKSAPAKFKDMKDQVFTIQASPLDCTGCQLCVVVCPAKSKEEPKLRAMKMVPLESVRQDEVDNWNFFLGLPEVDRSKLNLSRVKDVQLVRPLFEFSGACAGCGETPYLKLLSQLFGDRAIIGNATGCSSIYGGNLPTTPWAIDEDGRGPAWSNSLFEDNAEFGFGMRLAIDKQNEYARELVKRLSSDLGDDLVKGLLESDQKTEADTKAQRDRVKVLKKKLGGIRKSEAKELLAVADTLVKKSVWLVGGDGWAYDIGYGGLDHCLAMGRDINALVLDTEVYSNTGGQMSKATPRGAVAKFAAGGKPSAKKDLAMMAMAYGSVYVARVAFGANDAQCVKAFLEAEAYEGPSLIVAYSHCIAHGYNLLYGLDQQKAAVASGYWPLMRYNPDLAEQGKNPLQIDSKAPSIPLEEYVYNETRYKMLTQSKPEAAKKLLELAQKDVNERWRLYEHWATMPVNGSGEEDDK
jgi:pyruvate-ferredoxin/flavodoxin oxidoreductase